MNSDLERGVRGEAPRVIGGFGELAGDYDAALCDVWGVLHDGVKAHPGAGDALMRFRAGGGAVVLVSNAPRPGHFVVDMLDGFGVPRRAYDDVVTSGDVTRRLLGERAGARVHHLGPERDHGVFDDLGIVLSEAESAEIVCCTGLEDDEVETPEDYRARLEPLAARGVPMVCANPDLVVERGAKLIYCAGALADLYAGMGGDVTYAGKPYGPVYAEALRRAAVALGRDVPLDRVIGIGDALRTDLAGARDFGFDALLIARGIHAGDLIEDGAVSAERAARLLAAEALSPVGVQDKLVW